MTWKKVQGLAETPVAWKASQNPQVSSSQLGGELIYFSERNKEHWVYSKLGGERTPRLFQVQKGHDKINSPWTASRVSWGPFRTLLGTKVKEGITPVAGAHVGRLPLTGKSKSSLQIFMTSK